MRGGLLLACLALAGAATAMAMNATRGDSPNASPIATTDAGGSFSLANSRDGMPIFTAANIGPGDRAKGTVEIANEGSEAIAVTLAQHDLIDMPGEGGGLLSQHLHLKVGEADAPQPVYEGLLAAMSPRALPRLAPGAARTYEFVAILPESGTASAAENAVQGASTSVAYSWTAQVAPPTEEDPSPARPAPDLAPSGASSAPSPSPRFSVRVVRYRHTLRNGRIVAWVRCNQACRVKSRGHFRAQEHPGRLRPTTRHAERRRFGAKTRRLSLRVPSRQRRVLASAARAEVRIVVIARNRSDKRARTSKLLRLRRSAR